MTCWPSFAEWAQQHWCVLSEDQRCLCQTGSIRSVTSSQRPRGALCSAIAAGNSIATTNADRTLLWQGNSPLIFLREYGRVHQLVFNFDVAHANVDRLPAFVLLIRRFVETLRSEKIALESRNVELGQPLEIAAKLSDELVELAHFVVERQS